MQSTLFLMLWSALIGAGAVVALVYHRPWNLLDLLLLAPLPLSSAPPVWALVVAGIYLVRRVELLARCLVMTFRLDVLPDWLLAFLLPGVAHVLSSRVATAPLARTVPIAPPIVGATVKIEPVEPGSEAFIRGSDDGTRSFGPNGLNPPPTPAEQEAIQRMIQHVRTAAKASKASTIEAGFSVRKGGSAKYQRASAIYDALFPAPVPAGTPRYADLDEQRRPTVPIVR